MLPLFVVQAVGQEAGDHHSARAEPMRRQGDVGVSGEGAGAGDVVSEDL